MTPRAGSFILKQAWVFVASAVLACLCYSACVCCELFWSNRGVRILDTLTMSAAFLFFGGFVFVFLPLILPWAVAVKVFPRDRRSGKVYFPLVGAVLTFLIGCAVASLMPKPFFVEDQTFFQGIVIAAEREGICFALAGLTFGASYWFLCERYILVRKT